MDQKDRKKAFLQVAASFESSDSFMTFSEVLPYQEKKGTNRRLSVAKLAPSRNFASDHDLSKINELDLGNDYPVSDDNKDRPYATTLDQIGISESHFSKQTKRNSQAVTGTQTIMPGSITGSSVRHIRDNVIAGRLTLGDLKRTNRNREKLKKIHEHENDFDVIREHVEG